MTLETANPIFRDLVDKEGSLSYDMHLRPSAMPTAAWIPSKVRPKALSFYLSNMKRCWPTKVAKYDEDMALHLLALNNYSPEHALIVAQK